MAKIRLPYAVPYHHYRPAKDYEQVKRAWLALLLLAGISHFVDAEDVSALLSRMQQADDLTHIDDSTLKPWHLKVSFQLSDDNGKPKEQGTLEEWWAPNRSKRVFTSPSYTAILIANENGVFITPGAKFPPYLLQLIDQEIVHPLPQAKYLADAKPSQHTAKSGKLAIDCIAFTFPVKGEVSISTDGHFPTYCFDHGKSQLRVSSVSGGIAVVRNRLGTFQQRSVPVEVLVSVGGKIEISASIVELQELSPNETPFALPPDLERIDLNKIKLPGGAMRGLFSPAPEYPTRSKLGGISGKVVLSCSIGTDGHVHSLSVASSSNDDLAKAAMKAVSQWLFTPYTINSMPIEVETEIVVNFSFG